MLRTARRRGLSLLSCGGMKRREVDDDNDYVDDTDIMVDEFMEKEMQA